MDVSRRLGAEKPQSSRGQASMGHGLRRSFRARSQPLGPQAGVFGALSFAYETHGRTPAATSLRPTRGNAIATAAPSGTRRMAYCMWSSQEHVERTGFRAAASGAPGSPGRYRTAAIVSLSLPQPEPPATPPSPDGRGGGEPPPLAGFFGGGQQAPAGFREKQIAASRHPTVDPAGPGDAHPRAYSTTTVLPSCSARNRH